MTHLGERSVLVTGAASGFGRIMASKAAEAGARVTAVDVNAEALESLVSSLTSDGRSVIGVVGDVGVRADLQDAVRQGVDAHGFVDVAVLNAGIMPLAFYADHARAADAWDRCIDINLRGVLNGITAVYDHMIGLGRGHVVCISSIYGNHAVQGSAVYSATKAAVNVLADALRQETQGRIKVTTVRPTGVLGTGLGASIVNGDAMVGILGQHAQAFGDTVGRLMKGEATDAELDPDDIAYWSISPDELAAQVLYTIDQPWGVNIAEVTVRASGEQYLL
ncbi:MAG: putative oxidoreductase, short-chain dehydrogenase/reductase family [Ilumatobacteraceae bacterium]|nr:putative oxidoreductase, short-chain dehydrogenase/reductase family [Ilumatobacteraceae bacterium]